MNHDDLVLWADKNAANIVRTIAGSDATLGGKTWEWPVKQRRSTSFQIVGYVDLFLHVTPPDQAARGAVRWIAIEAKPRIDSVGQVIRQMRTYQAVMNDEGLAGGIFAVLSPDTRYAGLLREQGFAFIEPEGPQGLLL